jgi:PilX N-terminal
MSMRPGDERGATLIVALMAMLLLMALGLALMLTTTTELLIAGNDRQSYEGVYAAEASLERAIQELGMTSDWNAVLAGTSRSAFVDGPPSGLRLLPDGSTISLTEATNVANCGKPSVCSPRDMDAITEERPWGMSNPRWMLYAYAPLRDLLPPATIDSPFYVMAWVGDDPSENDGDPTRDGTADTNPGRGILMLRSDAFGPGGAHHVVEAAVARSDPGTMGVRLLSWHERR